MKHNQLNFLKHLTFIEACISTSIQKEPNQLYIGNAGSIHKRSPSIAKAGIYTNTWQYKNNVLKTPPPNTK
jgi:hypothetical protein